MTKFFDESGVKRKFFVKEFLWWGICGEEVFWHNFLTTKSHNLRIIIFYFFYFFSEKEVLYTVILLMSNFSEKKVFQRVIPT